jgi:hypothetical protein
MFKFAFPDGRAAAQAEKPRRYRIFKTPATGPARKRGSQLPTIELEHIAVAAVLSRGSVQDSPDLLGARPSLPAKCFCASWNSSGSIAMKCSGICHEVITYLKLDHPRE